MFGASIGMTSFIVISICCAYKQIPAMFYISLVSAILMGVQSALGESTTLGFLKSFPGDSVGFYGSGTGFAGIFASGTLILLKSLNFQDSTIYLIAAPTVVPYFLCFRWLDKQKQNYAYV